MAIVDITGFERMRREQREREKAEKERSKELENTNTPEEPQNPTEGENEGVEIGAGLDVESLTKDQITTELDKLNVEYNVRDTKGVLKALLIDELNKGV